MAYRRRQQPTNAGIMEEEKLVVAVDEGKEFKLNDYAAAFQSKATRTITTTTAAANATTSSSLYSSSSSSSYTSSTATSLAAKAIRASSAAHSHRDSSLSSAYAHNHPVSPHTSSSSSAPSISNRTTPPPSKGWDSKPFVGENASIRNFNEAKQRQQQQQQHQPQQQGFWGNLARKAKSLLEVDDDNPPLPSPLPPQRQHHHHIPRIPTKTRNSNSNYGSHQKKDSPTLQKSLNAISSSLSYIGGAVEEGLTIVENRTVGIVQETRKHIRSKPIQSTTYSQETSHSNTQQPSQRQIQMQPQMQTDIELQLKASRDVAMAMAAKAKLLLRELKTVKADLAFAKERCAQLEEENKILRENRERGDNPEDDDLIRLQLETLLAEKARLAHENSVYARENRFLREVVEYHQLTMQDVVYLDEGTEEVTEVYPVKVVSNSQTVNTTSLPLPTESSVDSSLRIAREFSPLPVPPPGLQELSQSAATPSLYSPTTVAMDTKGHLNPSV